MDKLPDEFFDRVTDPADLLLEKLRDSISREGVEAKYYPASGDAAEAIVRVADQIGADLIVVGNKGMKGVRRVLGSVPNSVAHTANCSVLIVDTVSDSSGPRVLRRHVQDRSRRPPTARARRPAP